MLFMKTPLRILGLPKLCRFHRKNAEAAFRAATFYRHFKDKNAFFEWYLQTITEQFLAEAEDANGVESLES